MAYIKKRTAAKKTLKKPAKIYEVDGFRYKSKALKDLHETLTKHPLIHTFSIPTVETDKKSKYGAKKIELNGLQFDSAMEGKFYIYLLEQQQEGAIKSFERQIKYELQEKFRDEFTGKVVLPITYIADFVIHAQNGGVTVVDVKGQETSDFKLKKKMFCYKYRSIQFMCVQWREGEWQDLEDIKKDRRKKKAAKKTQTKEKDIPQTKKLKKAS